MPVAAGIGDQVMVDIDATIIEVHGHAEQGSGYGCSGVRGLTALLATVTTKAAAPVIVAHRLRKGPVVHLEVPNAWSPTRWPRSRSCAHTRPVPRFCWVDSAFYGRGDRPGRGPRRPERRTPASPKLSVDRG